MMTRKPLTLADEIRREIDRSGMSRYAVCKIIGLDQGVMSRFMNDPNAGLSCEKINRLAALLDLHIVKGKGKAKG